MMCVLGLIADDLTGAGDASVQFATRGWRTFLTLADSWRLPDSALRTLGLSVSRSQTSIVIAVTTDCRALSNEAAEKLTADALQRADERWASIVSS